MKKIEYQMESDEESLRLDLKTDIEIIEKQALWAGIKPGMRVADIGCGPGKITATLCKLVSPGGSALGIDGSNTRLDYEENILAAIKSSLSVRIYSNLLMTSAPLTLYGFVSYSNIIVIMPQNSLKM